MELDVNEVKQLCYRSKRGIQTEAEMKRFFKLSKKFAGNPDFEKARICGQAQAMCEVNPSFGFDYWVEQLSRPIKVTGERIIAPDLESRLTQRAADLAVCTCDEPEPMVAANVCMKCLQIISPNR